MKAYRVVEVDASPAVAWADMKATANHITETICKLFRQETARVKETCGQTVTYADILFEDVRVSVYKDHIYVVLKHEDDKANTYSGPYLHLPDDVKGHWNVSASNMRTFIDRLLQACQQETVASAVDAALEGLLHRYARTFGHPGDIR